MPLILIIFLVILIVVTFIFLRFFSFFLILILIVYILNKVMKFFEKKNVETKNTGHNHDDKSDFLVTEFKEISEEDID